MAELMTAVLEQPPAQIAGVERLPSTLHEAILRGLDKQPERRWPAIASLLECIETVLVSAPPGVFEGDRPPLAILPMFVGLPVVLITLELTGLLRYSAASWAIISAAQILLMLGVIILLRRRLITLVNDRRVLALPFLIGLFILGHRAIALATGSSLEVMFAYDFLANAGIASIMTFLVERRAWPTIVLSLLLVVLAVVQPSWAPRLWLAFTLGLPSLVALSLARSRDRLRGDVSRSGTSRPGATPRPSPMPE
jgi:hypothetical protein